MIDHEIYEDYLKHYGVKGMRWGIRRSKRVQAARDRHSRREGKRVPRKIRKFQKKADAINKLMADPNSQDRLILVGVPGHKYSTLIPVRVLNQYAMAGGEIDLKKTKIVSERTVRRYQRFGF